MAKGAHASASKRTTDQTLLDMSLKEGKFQEQAKLYEVTSSNINRTLKFKKKPQFSTCSYFYKYIYLKYGSL